MQSDSHRVRHAVRLCLPIFLLMVSFAFALAPSLRGDQKEAPPVSAQQPNRDAKSADTPASPFRRLEAQFTDGGKLRVILLDDHVPFKTPYGDLVIPVTAIKRIEFASTIPEEVAQQIDTAVTNLGSPQYQLRQSATSELLRLGARAYPAIVRASNDNDLEVAERAKNIAARIQETVPSETLVVRDRDVIYTNDSKISGQIAVKTLKLDTAQFGEQNVKLIDLRDLGEPSAEDSSPANVRPDPGNLTKFRQYVGKTFFFRVNAGKIQRHGSIWGTDLYTLDSTLAMAAIHAGVLKPGETGVVRVVVMGPQKSFQGSARHGITSSNWSEYPGSFKVSK